MFSEHSNAPRRHSAIPGDRDSSGPHLHHPRIVCVVKVLRHQLPAP